jgi:asparagine synthase (glutamine-hydrolysing)
MLRYVAFAWNHAEPERRAAAGALLQRILAVTPAWHTAIHQQGLAVCYRTTGDLDGTYVMHNGTGVVLGSLFERAYEGGAHPRNVSLDESNTAAILATAGRELVSRWWGRYVAFIRSSQERKAWVLRDPTGDINCFSTVIRGVNVFFNRFEDCEQLRPRQFSINWPWVITDLALRTREHGKTGLNEIQEVLAGECVEIQGEQHVRRFYWNPLQIATSEVIQDFERAAAETRHCIRACVHAWASRAGGILELLSGGLHSSIIASCLQDAPDRPEVTFLNYDSPGSDTDDRHFARMVANHSGFELIERPRVSDFSLVPLLALPGTPLPSYCFSHLESGTAELRLARDRQASVVVYGVGGDWLFYLRGHLPAATDYAYRHWVGSKLFGRVPQLVPAAVKEAAGSRDDYVHPLYRSTRDIPPCKLYHAHLITSSTSPTYNPFDRDTDPVRLSPLCSQPLMELSLRIPADILTLGGRDRAIARRAFSKDVPEAIILGKSTGGMEEHAKAVVRNNMNVVRELLLDGVLVKERLLERAGLELILSGDPARTQSYVAELFDYLSLEAWCRSW